MSQTRSERLQVDLDSTDSKEQSAECGKTTGSAPQPPPRRRPPKLGRPKAELESISASKQNDNTQGVASGVRFASPSNRGKPEADKEPNIVNPRNANPESPRKKPPKLGRPKASTVKVAQKSQGANRKLEPTPEGVFTAEAELGSERPESDGARPEKNRPASEVPVGEEKTLDNVQSEASKAAGKPEAVKDETKFSSSVSKNPTEATTGAAAEQSKSSDYPTKEADGPLPGAIPAPLPPLRLPDSVKESQECSVRDEPAAPEHDTVARTENPTRPSTPDRPPEQKMEGLDGTRPESSRPKRRLRKLGPPKIGKPTYRHEAKVKEGVSAPQSDSGTAQAAQKAANVQTSGETLDKEGDGEGTGDGKPKSPRPRPKPRKLGRPKAELETNPSVENSARAHPDNSGTDQTAQRGKNAQTSGETIEIEDEGNGDKKPESPRSRPKSRKFGRPKAELESQAPKKMPSKDESTTPQKLLNEHRKLKAKSGTTPSNSKSDSGVRGAKDALIRKLQPLIDVEKNPDIDHSRSPLRAKPTKLEPSNAGNEFAKTNKQTVSNDKILSSTPDKPTDAESGSATTKTKQNPKEMKENVVSAESQSRAVNDSTASPSPSPSRTKPPVSSSKPKTEIQSPKPKKLLAKKDGS